MTIDNGQVPTTQPQVQPAAVIQPQPLSPALAPYTPLAPNGQLPANLVNKGFVLPSTTLQPRIIMDISGDIKTGKSRIALTSTSPVAYFAFDPLGIEGVVEEFARAGKSIMIKKLPFPMNADTAIYQQLYAEMLEAIQEIRTWERGTVVIDTGAALELLVRLKLFGKAKGVGTYSYEARNAEMEAIFNLLSETKLNIIYLHNMKKVWGKITDSSGNERSTPTGELEPDRFDMVGQRVQINAATYRERLEQGRLGDFHLYITNCRLKSDLGGYDYTVPMGDMVAIPVLMSWIFQRSPQEFV